MIISVVALLTQTSEVKRIRNKRVSQTMVDFPNFFSLSFSNMNLNHKNPNILQKASIRYDSVDIASADHIMKNRKNTPHMKRPIIPVTFTRVLFSFLAL